MDLNSPISSDSIAFELSKLRHNRHLQEVDQRYKVAIGMQQIANRHRRQGLIDHQNAREASISHLPWWLKQLMDTSYTRNAEENRSMHVDTLNTTPVRSKIIGMQLGFFLFSACIPTIFVSLVVGLLSGRYGGFSVVVCVVAAGLVSALILMLSKEIVDERTAKRGIQRYRKWIYYQLSATKNCSVMHSLAGNL